ncbi:phage tail protein [Pseudomonas saxonica]|uniref:Phage tail protein n=1 Tax=Pseudomonas saxonica TaxID=2600598 RepID=A0ABY3GLZ0_9PSED|nr:phage tail protein [Pseudomonas saxonica]TWR92106.1 phage tail protein [Pseudomonas saxonica]
MAYMEQLLAGLKYLTAAGETGRRSLDGMLGPVNGAINEITGAASELDDLPFIGPAVGAKVQRLMRGVSAAQAKAGAVVATYNKATRAASQIDERLGVLKEQTGKAATALNKIAGNVSPSLANIIPTGAFGIDATPAAEAVKPFPHLLIMQSLKPGSTPFYFNLDTAAFDELKRSSEYRWASQERLSRRPAQQAVGMGEERITLSGSIFGGFKGGIKQLDTLRSIGAQLQPLGLITGYGDVLGNWCLKNIEEEQSALLQGGIPRKQGFTLEFVRYGDDLQNS